MLIALKRNREVGVNVVEKQKSNQMHMVKNNKVSKYDILSAFIMDNEAASPINV